MTEPTLAERLEAERFDAFNEDERDVLHYALSLAAKDILERAGHDRIEKDLLPQAGATFALASALARELDVRAGRPLFGDSESILMAAATISEGLAPEAMKYAAEVEACDGQCGAARCDNECQA